MGVWTLSHEGGKVKLFYTHEPLSENPLVQPCGEIDLAAESDLEAWVFDQAALWDRIETRRGSFHRQRACSDAPPSIAAACPQDTLSVLC